MPRLESFQPSINPESEQPEEHIEKSSEKKFITSKEFVDEYMEDPDGAVEHAMNYLKEKFEKADHKSPFGISEFHMSRTTNDDDLMMILIKELPESYEETPLSKAFTDFMTKNHITEEQEHIIAEHVRECFEKMRQERMH